MGSRLALTLSQIQSAQKTLNQYLSATPLVHNAWLSDAMGCEVFLKLETLQPIGAFKIRGATNRISKLSPEEKKRGVIAASAGNHAQGVAWGAKRLGVSAMIVMPTGAPIVKVQNTRAMGAQVILEGNSYDQAYAAAKEIMQKTNRVFVHAFEDEEVIAGQGTIGLEILEQLPEVDCVIGSVGGGGLMAGVSEVMKSLRPQVKMIACQSAKAPSMIHSVRQGKAIQLESADTFADGIALKQASERMRELLAPRIDEWVEVDEDLIAASVLSLLEKSKTLVEGSGAIVLGALSKVKHQLQGKKVALIVSGGNIDVNLLSRIIDVGLIQAGRRVRVNVLIQDRPGALAHLTDLIAKQGSNILQAIHDRNEPSTKFDQTEVELTLETRGPDHSSSLIEALKSQVLRLELTH